MGMCMKSVAKTMLCSGRFYVFMTAVENTGVWSLDGFPT